MSECSDRGCRGIAHCTKTPWTCTGGDGNEYLVVTLGDLYADVCCVCGERGTYGVASQKGPEGCREAVEKGRVYCEEHVPDHPEFVRRAVCAAIRHLDTGMIIAGARHGDVVMRVLMEATGGARHWRGKDEPGFIDQKGRFMNRAQAWDVALASGQEMRDHPSVKKGMLFSEDLY